MSHLDIFRKFGLRDGLFEVFTEQSSGRIPSTAGCYAWFLPLWLKDTDLYSWLALLRNVLFFDTKPVDMHSFDFRWEHMYVSIEKKIRTYSNDSHEESWDICLSNETDKEALQEKLMQASLLLPPLYVGRTSNLNRRYHEHVSSTHKGPNNFNRRFTRCAETFGLEISVSELLFACIEINGPIQAASNAHLTNSKFDQMIEFILMHLSQPPFSER